MAKRAAEPIGEFALDRSSPVPLYFQVAQQLEESIASGRLTPGMRLENELEMAEKLGLSRPTMRRAMQHLVEKGLVVRRRGVGTRIVSPQVRRSLELTSLNDDLIRGGQRPTTKVLTFEETDADEEAAAALGVAVGAQVLKIARLRSAMDQPIAKLTNYLPIGLLDISSHDLTERGLYELIRGAGIQMHSATQAIGARTATAAEARLLGESMPAALLTMQRTAFDDHGNPVEFGSHFYAANRYSFQMSLLST
jgi:GntR family transcriptional regulator